MLEMIDVSKTYPGGNVALRNINIRIEQGEFVFIVGPSGAGKSTFIKMLFREVLPTSGNILLNDVDILKLTAKEVPYLRRQLGIIFQDYRLLPDRTVYDNVAFAMQVIEAPYRKIKRRVMNVWVCAAGRIPNPTSCPAGNSSVLPLPGRLSTAPVW